MATIYDLHPNKVIHRAKEELKSLNFVNQPKWAGFVKTGVHKERPPVQKDWWYIRSAAVLQSVYKLGPIGTSKLRKKYGGKKNRGVKPEHFYEGSGNILRKVLQQLEKAELVVHNNKGNHKGRMITPKGKSFLDKISSAIEKEEKSKHITYKTEHKDNKKHTHEKKEHKKLEE